jgi:hypothetical protein
MQMKFFLSLIAMLFISTYSYSAFPIHSKEKPIEKQQNAIEKNDQHNALGYIKAMPHAGPSGHGMAILAIVLGIIGLFYLHLVFGILAVIIGFLSMRKHPFRRPLALAGFILGIIDLMLLL